ncbi:MAG TPA: ParA family protein [Rhodocyclaceae bacterium]|nr:ParA family protein [Rhodocyclaceae bacterium]
MTVIAVVNRKGGSGKSTLATNVAGYLASLGHDVMLGDVDKQQSSRLWLSLRPEHRPRINGWSIDERNFARPPAGIKHVVLDTPGGFHSLGMMKVALYADAILIPTTPTVFDRAAAADCVKELRTFPRIASGKCEVACIGMRIDGRTKNASALETWANTLALPYLGTIKAAQAYSKCLEQGLSIFDFQREKVEAYLQEWSTVTAWLNSILSAETPEPKIIRPVELRATTHTNVNRSHVQPEIRPSHTVRAPRIAPTIPGINLNATMPVAAEIPEYLRR